MPSERTGSATQTVSRRPSIYLPSPSPHPLDQLSVEEVDRAREFILTARSPASITFRTITLEEPAKAILLPFLTAEHHGELDASTLRPPRLARVLYDCIAEDRSIVFCDSVVDVETGEETKFKIVDKRFHSALNADEIAVFPKVAMASQLFKDALDELNLPRDTVVVIDPWMYGGWENPDEISPRYMQGLVYARDPKTNNPDSNHYAFPLPLIPVMDVLKKEIVRVDRLATGGKEDGLNYGTRPAEALTHCRASEYIPELVEGGLRQDVKPLHVVQPAGPSFTVTGNLVEWQKWRFRIGFNSREGATLHDVWYDGRSVLYRVSFSEMSVPYGDPRAPFHRKQAFDFGDGGAGRAANNLELGCDCLGLIKYFDATMCNTSGKGIISKNVVCMHEIDDGILWKHTNYRTGRAVVTRNRKLVVQFIITLANYEYIFAYHFDQAGAITIETRATGVVSTVAIDPGKTSPWGNVVSPGVLAQNHQHIFCVRIDPAIDGYQNNTVIQEESHPLPYCAETNPYGNGYEVKQTVFKTSCAADAAPQHNRIFKIVNQNVFNPVSGRPVGYKFTPSPTQLTLAHPDSVMAKRMAYGSHHVWITRHRDDEFWAAGQYTNQSSYECGGLKDMVERKDNIEDEDIVVWNSFALTHNPRAEDFPVMPVEVHQIHLKPADFFSRNPAIDVPSLKDKKSTMYGDGGLINGSVATLRSSNGRVDAERRQNKLIAEENGSKPVQQGVVRCCI